MSGYKKNSITHQQGTLGLCYRLLCTNLGDGILCALSPDHNIHGENSVYHWWTTQWIYTFFLHKSWNMDIKLMFASDAPLENDGDW